MIELMRFLSTCDFFFFFGSTLTSLRNFHVKVLHWTSFLSCNSGALWGQKSLHLVIDPLSNQRQNV